MDVVTAFLHPEIDQTDILMNFPQLHGIGDLSEFNLNTDGCQTVRLRKALYGLKQSPRLWYKEIDSFLKSLNFRQSIMEPNLYLTKNIMILLYMDDLQLFFNSRKEVEEIKRKLREKYWMVDLRPARRFLGMNIDRTELGYALYQTSYIESLLQRFKMTDAYGVDTPIDNHVSLDIAANDTDKPTDQTEYLARVGSLMYAATGTQPDISYTVGLLCSYNANPCTRHLTAAKRVLRYLKKTKNLRLIYTTDTSKHDLYGFVDSDWAKSQDRKSIGGYAFMLSNTAISWSSKKQALVAQSTKEAEYTAFNEVSREALWLRQLLSDINNCGSQPDSEPPVADTTVIYADNQGAIKHTNTKGITARTKHFDIYLKHARDLQQKEIVRFTYIQSAENTADILTKGLPAPSHHRHVENLGLGDLG